MNLRLVACLSCFGVVLGVASVLGVIHPGQERWFWLVTAVVSIIVIARAAPGRYFMHGFLVGLFAGMLAPLIQGLAFNSFLAHNPSADEAFKRLPASIPPRVLVICTAPVLGIATGLILGLFTWLAGKLMGRKQAPMPA